MVDSPQGFGSRRSRRHLFNFLLRSAVSGILLYFVFARVNFNLIGQRLSKVEYTWLVAAVLIFIAQTTLGALRWQRIVHQCSAADTRRFAISTALRYTFIAAFFNQILPSTVGGDAVRTWLLARDQGAWRVPTYSVLIDRLAGVLVLTFLVILCLPCSFALISNDAARIALLILGFGSFGACFAFLSLGFIGWRWLDRWWLTRQLVATASMAGVVLGSASSGAPIVAYSLLMHVLSVTAAWCLAKGVAAPLEWSQALLLVLPVLLVATIPLSIAGWGTRETAMVLAFGYAGLTESDGLIVSVLLGMAIFAADLLGGVLWIYDGVKQFHNARGPHMKLLLSQRAFNAPDKG